MSTKNSNAGASAKREYQRRRGRLKAQRVERWGPTIGAAVDQFSGEPAGTSSWSKGAAGEAAVAEYLEKRLANSHCVLLHDRSIPGTRRNIDHIVVGPSGVTVVDTKNIKGKVRVVNHGFGSRGRKVLTVAGADRTKMIDGVLDQVARVKHVVDSIGLPLEVPVLGAICWWKADGLPLIGTPEVRGVKVLSPSGTVQLARGPIRIGESRIDEVRVELAARFPMA